jgi:hypothetical protein
MSLAPRHHAGNARDFINQCKGALFRVCLGNQAHDRLGVARPQMHPALIKIDPHAIDRYWRSVEDAMTEVLSIAQVDAERLADRYRRSLTETEQMLVLHREALDVAADLGDRPYLDEALIERYRQIRDRGPKRDPAPTMTHP